MVFLTSTLVASAALVVALRFGSAPMDLGAWLAAVTGNGEALDRQLVLDLRLPRALNAFAVGALLAMAGALMQILLRNPLADPYILGVSSGAAVAALTAITLGLGAIAMQLWAFAGALAVTLVVYQVTRFGRDMSPVRLLLTGVVVAAGLNAVISLMLALGNDASLRGMLFWLMGDFSFAGDPRWPLGVAALALAASLPLARHLDVLALGEKQAALLGLATAPARVTIYVAASLLTAVAVTTAGSIGFVGLGVPHAVRLVAGPAHRILLPASALLGGGLLVLADTAARTVAAPRQLPVGALTAFIGVPFFLYLMTRSRRRLS